MNIDLFKDNLKYEIKKAGFTQEDFADKIGIGGSTLRTYLSKKNNTIPDLTLLCKMCDVLNCDIDYLIGRINFTTHAAKQVYTFTGIVEEAYMHLKVLKDNKGTDADIRLSTLNKILVSEEFNEILHYISNARIAYTGFPIKYNSKYLSKLNNDDLVSVYRLFSENDDYIDSREYHASKSLGILFDKIIQIPMEDHLMLYDYIDYYFKMFGEHFPTEDFNSDEDAAIQIKQCLLTCTPLSKRKDEEQ